MLRAGFTDHRRDSAWHYQGRKGRRYDEGGFCPQLFQSIHSRFPDGIPGEGTIKSFLMREGFSDVAVGPAINAFMETYREVENIRESESYGAAAEEAPESPSRIQEAPMQTQPMTAQLNATPAMAFTSGIPDLNKINMDIRGDQVLISGLLDLKGLHRLKKKIAGLEALLTPDDEGAAATSDDEDDDI